MQAVVAALALVPVSLVPIVQTCRAGLFRGWRWRWGWFIWPPRPCSAAGATKRSARRLLRISLVYLPALLVLFMLVPLV